MRTWRWAADSEARGGPSVTGGLARTSRRLAGLLLAAGAAFAAHAGQTLDGVKARGVAALRGERGDRRASRATDAAGRWHGSRRRFLSRRRGGGAGRSARRSRSFPSRHRPAFPPCSLAPSTCSLRNTTWTLPREALLRVRFPAVLFYDGQAVHGAGCGSAATKRRRPGGHEDLRRERHDHEQHLAAYDRCAQLSVEPVVVDSAAGAADALFAGKCAAYTSDASQLAGGAAARARRPAGLRHPARDASPRSRWRRRCWAATRSGSSRALGALRADRRGGVRTHARQRRADGQGDARPGRASPGRRRGRLRPGAGTYATTGRCGPSRPWATTVRCSSATSAATARLGSSAA